MPTRNRQTSLEPSINEQFTLNKHKKRTAFSPPTAVSGAAAFASLKPGADLRQAPGLVRRQSFWNPGQTGGQGLMPSKNPYF
jgi:hypothetical protein